MARINVEDHFWIEITALAAKLGNQDLAVGQVIRFWRIIQEKHKHKRTLNDDEFKAHGFSEHLFDLFAIRTPEGITARGAEKHFSWLRSRVYNGKMGGKQAQANRSKSKQAEPSSSSSSSSSSSISNSKNTIAQTDVRASELYDSYPRKVGRKKGLARLRTILAKNGAFEQIQLAITNYTSHCENLKMETKFIKHFTTFLSEWEDWLDPGHGGGKTFATNAVFYPGEEQ